MAEQAYSSRVARAFASCAAGRMRTAQCHDRATLAEHQLAVRRTFVELSVLALLCDAGRRVWFHGRRSRILQELMA